MTERKKRVWTEERLKYLKECVVGRTEVEGHRLFCECYPETTMSSFINAKQKYHISSGIKGGQFQKGHKTSYRHPKGYHFSKKTEFKKGHAPHNTKPLGTIRITKDGYYYIKVSMTGRACEKWKSMSSYVWEQNTGEKIDSSRDIVVYLNGDKSDHAFENLQKVSRFVHAIMCKHNWYTNEKERTRAYINIAILNHAQHMQMRKYKIDVYRFPSQQTNSKSFLEYQERNLKQE